MLTEGTITTQHPPLRYHYRRIIRTILHGILKIVIQRRSVSNPRLASLIMNTALTISHRLPPRPSSPDNRDNPGTTSSPVSGTPSGNHNYCKQRRTRDYRSYPPCSESEPFSNERVPPGQIQPLFRSQSPPVRRRCYTCAPASPGGRQPQHTATFRPLPRCQLDLRDLPSLRF